MKVYSVNQNNYYTYPLKQPQRPVSYPAAYNNFQKQTPQALNFTGLKFNYNGLLTKYIKIRSLKTSINGSKRPYLSMSRNLKDAINPVKIKINHFEEINAWDINPKNSDKYVIFLHGFSQNITNNQPLYEAITKTDYGVLAIDYRGYGKNKKTINFSENNMNEDVNAALKYLKNKGIEHISLIGHSFGGYLATKNSKVNYYDFQILVSPMLSLQFWLENVLKHPKKYKQENMMIKYIPNFRDQYRKVFRLHKHIAGNSTPTYIIHSKTDRYISYKDIDVFAHKLHKFQNYTLLERGGHKMDDVKIEAIVDTLNKLSLENEIK